MSLQKIVKPTRKTETPFTEFEKYENGRKRKLQYDANALADFEQETGMGFAQLIKQKALFGTTRAILWAGLKRQDRVLTLEQVGDLISAYMTDEDFDSDDHNINALMTIAMSACVEQGALGRVKRDPNAEGGVVVDRPAEPAALDGEVVNDPNATPTSSDTMTS